MISRLDMAEERVSVLENPIETSETENKSEWGLKKKKECLRTVE